MKIQTFSFALLYSIQTWKSCYAFVSPPSKMIKQQQQPIIKQMSIMDTNNYDVIDESIENRRKFLTNIVSSTAAATFFSHVSPSYADEDGAVSVSTETAEITDKIYLEFQGLPSPTEGDMYATSNNRIVIGLFGKDAPEPVSILKQLVSTRQIGREGSGYMAPCKPREIRTLQREQLEANKVYNSCKESQDAGLGVSYELSTVWRVDKDNRIDLGAVAGKVRMNNCNFGTDFLSMSKYIFKLECFLFCLFLHLSKNYPVSIVRG